MLSKCPYCGETVEKGDIYCVRCGAKLPEETAPAGQDGGGGPKLIIATSNPTVRMLEEKFLTYEGRLNRKPYFIRILMMSVLGWIGKHLWDSFYPFSLSGTVLMVLGAILCVIAFVAGIMLVIRRLHDMDRTGWLALLSFIPIVGFIFALVLLLFKGTEGPNKYGEDPLTNPVDW